MKNAISQIASFVQLTSQLTINYIMHNETGF